MDRGIGQREDLSRSANELLDRIGHATVATVSIDGRRRMPADRESVVGRALNAIDENHVNGSSRWFQLEAELIL
jgi:hypothetical protein